jgi:hypothetical protein
MKSPPHAVDVLGSVVVNGPDVVSLVTGGLVVIGGSPLVVLVVLVVLVAGSACVPLASSASTSTRGPHATSTIDASQRTPAVCLNPPIRTAA